MVRNGPKWSEMVRNAQKCSEMVRNGPKLSDMSRINLDNNPLFQEINSDVVVAVINFIYTGRKKKIGHHLMFGFQVL